MCGLFFLCSEFMRSIDDGILYYHLKTSDKDISHKILLKIHLHLQTSDNDISHKILLKIHRHPYTTNAVCYFILSSNHPLRHLRCSGLLLCLKYVAHADAKQASWMFFTKRNSGDPAKTGEPRKDRGTPQKPGNPAKIESPVCLFSNILSLENKIIFSFQLRLCALRLLFIKYKCEKTKQKQKIFTKNG